MRKIIDFVSLDRLVIMGGVGLSDQVLGIMNWLAFIETSNYPYSLSAKVRKIMGALSIID